MKEEEEMSILRNIIYEFYALLWDMRYPRYVKYTGLPFLNKQSCSYAFSHVYQFPLPRKERFWLVHRALKKGHAHINRSSTFLSSSCSHRIFPTFTTFLSSVNGYFSSFIVKIVLKWKILTTSEECNLTKLDGDSWTQSRCCEMTALAHSPVWWSNVNNYSCSAGQKGKFMKSASNLDAIWRKQKYF